MILGPELILNGTFTGNADNWVIGGDPTGFQYGTDNIINNGGSAYAYTGEGCEFTLVSGKKYQGTFTLNGGDGSVRFEIVNPDTESDEYDITISAPPAPIGTYPFTFVCSTSTLLANVTITAEADFNSGTVDDVSLKEVIGEGNLITRLTKALCLHKLK